MKIEIICDWCGKPVKRYPSQVKAHNFCSRGCLGAYSSRSKNPEGYAGLKDYTNISSHMSELNRILNPTRMTPETRAKLRNFRLRQSHRQLKELRKQPRNKSRKPLTKSRREHLRQIHLDTGKGKSYRKYFGRHEHRVIAEQMLGRPLRPGEVVHHIDEDKRNNSPENLMVFASQKEHAAYHAKMNRFFGITGGDDT